MYFLFVSLLVPPTCSLPPYFHHVISTYIPPHCLFPSYISLLLCLEQLQCLGYSITITWITYEERDLNS